MNDRSKADAAVDMLANAGEFHRYHGRHALYRAAPTPPVFESRTRTWLINDPQLTLEIITKMPTLALPTQLAKFSERFSVDTDPFRSLNRNMALYLNGEEHAQSRRRITEFLAKRRPAVKIWLEETMTGFFAPLNRPGRVELISQVMRPMILSFLTAFSGIDMTRIDIELVAVLIDNTLRLKTRLEGLDQVLNLRRHIAKNTGLDVESDELNVLAVMTMFGNDSLTRTYGESLKFLVEEQPGKKFSEMAIPDVIPKTGVPFLERSVGKPFKAGGVEFETGQRIRMFLQVFEYETDLSNAHRFFGAGAHVCPGRPVSVDFWRAIAVLLRTFETRPRVIAYEGDTSNHFFVGPKLLELELS